MRSFGSPQTGMGTRVGRRSLFLLVVGCCGGEAGDVVGFCDDEIVDDEIGCWGDRIVDNVDSTRTEVFVDDVISDVFDDVA